MSHIDLLLWRSKSRTNEAPDFRAGVAASVSRAVLPARLRRGRLERRGRNPSRVIDEFVVIAPQLPFAGDIWHRYAGEVRAVIDAAVERHGGDARRRYLTGFSFGGNGVFDLALLQPDFWAALWPVDPTPLWPVDPTRVPSSDPGCPIWLSFGEVARQRKAAFIHALRLEPARPARQGERLYLDQGEDHVGSARRAYGDETIYSWLLGKRCD
jgi:hypothetical protein